MKDIPVAIEIIPSTRRKKTVSMEVYPSRVILRVPHSLSKTAIYEFVEKRQKWLVQKWQEIQHRTTSEMPSGGVRRLPPRQVFVHGRGYELSHVTNTESNRIRVQQNGSVIEITQPAAIPGEDLTSQTRMTIITWLKQEARRDFLDRLQRWSRTMGVSYQDFRLKDQKTRWGSCSSAGNINLNWRLIQAPEWVIDYVVIHELAHLTELNHSPAFWRIVRNFCPNYEDAKMWLKSNAANLLAW
ncbi:hypothetical protein AN477_11040 [Alicyclobacillus ferrooxydans]|uniref:YgjP-like metallopeptidase domain-containing protein n=1 Tax=Alicyclobacillus ferrooxydans TaxID=471514 RepID=A0A0P9CL47_9BACL|nr:hypothetical protein AN477_11040 [Alicyclobacillus ferrooxydans]